MDADLSKVTLDLAQLVLLGGMIWGLAKMSSSIDSLRTVTADLTAGLRDVGKALADMTSRVGILEERTGGRRRTDPVP